MAVLVAVLVGARRGGTRDFWVLGETIRGGGDGMPVYSRIVHCTYCALSVEVYD